MNKYTPRPEDERAHGFDVYKCADPNCRAFHVIFFRENGGVICEAVMSYAAVTDMHERIPKDGW